MTRVFRSAPGVPAVWMALLLLGWPLGWIFPAGVAGWEPPGVPHVAGPLLQEGESAGSGIPQADSLHPGASLTVFLMTIGQGDYVWERFSHNAIWIRDEVTGWEAAFNWGIFDFDQVGFVPRLIRGTMLYRMAAWDPRAYLEETRRNNRSVRLQELALTPEQRWDLYNFVEWNARPENMYYRYDYYRDNCSTRVRDALDQVLGGGIRRATAADTTRHTYRWHTRRLLRDVPWAYLGIQTVLGPRADRPITAWEEAFLPRRLMEIVREVKVPDGEGGMRPLVAEERELLTTTRPPVPLTPPHAFPWFLLPGVLWGGGILFLARRGPRLGVLGRTGLAALAGGWSFLAFLVGTLLLGAWLFTDHVFWARNLNLLQMNPLFLPLAAAFGMLLFRRSFPAWARKVAVALGVIAAMGLFVELLPGVGQANGEILAFTVPVNAGLVLASFRLGGEVSREGGSARSQVAESGEGRG